MTKNQLKKPKLKHPFSEVPKHKGILAITEGHDWKSVTRMGRFINANHPPKDATKEELETIARFWGKPTPEDTKWEVAEEPSGKTEKHSKRQHKNKHKDEDTNLNSRSI